MRNCLIFVLAVILLIPSGIETILYKEPVEEEERIEDVRVIRKENAELIATLVMAEATGEPEEGMRLVIDTVFNRVDSPYFPNSIEEVIYQPGAYSPISDGRIYDCYVKDDILDLVYQEAENRTDYDVIFFTAHHYSKYGTPMFQVGNHCFSSY